MVGDRLSTDVAFGNGGGARTLFVETGCETVGDIPKDPADDEIITAGQKVYATTDGIVTDVADGTAYLGKVVSDTAGSEPFVRVRLSQ